MSSESDEQAERRHSRERVPAFAASGYRRAVVEDAELAIAAAAGDRAALGQIYDRYADTLYELCRSILRDPHEASDAVQDTFVIVATRIGGLREKERLKPWLCAIARHESFRRSSKRARTRPSNDEVLDMPVADAAADGIFGNEAANLVWSAAESLTDRERVLLELNVRQGLEGAELADAAALPGPTASVVLSRAKSQLAVAVRGMLLVRFGRGGCEELAAIAPSGRDAFDALTRKRVARHATECARCEPRWNASPDALGILAAAPVVGAPAALKSKVLNDPRLISSSKSLGRRGWRRNGFPPLVEKRARRPIIASVAAAVVLALVATALVIAADDDVQHLTVPGTPVTDASGSAVTNARGVIVTEPKSSATSTPGGSSRTTTRGGTGIGTTAGPGGTTTPTTETPSTTEVPRHITALADSSQLWTCNTGDPSKPRQTSVVATVDAGSDPESLWLHSINPQGVRKMDTMGKRGDHWYGTLGPFSSEGNVTWYVSDDPGDGGTKSTPSTIYVNVCPQ